MQGGMHSVLLIGEILQFIFDAVLNDGKPSLCSAARCCQAWKDPALDRIWRQLPSAVPLLSLLPGFSMENDNIRFSLSTQDRAFIAFCSYATRVRHIAHCHRVLVDSTNDPVCLVSHQLNHLESACIKNRAAGEVALRMSLAPRLRSLTLQVGYTKSNTAFMTVHDMISLLRGCSSLEQLSVRGHSSECLHGPLGRLKTLRSLSLHLSSTTEQALITVSTLPRLVDFDVHANHLSYDLLSTAIGRTCGASLFPALEKLRIRAEPCLITLILQQLPQSKLCSLYMDTTGPSPSPALDGLLKAASTLPLHELTLEHALSADESEDMLAYTPDRFFTLDHFRPLSKLPLRCLTIGSFLPVDLTDSDVEEMTRWWPLLERLELDSCSALEDAEMDWKPRNSLASLCALARGCRHLKALVITLNADPSLFSDSGLVSSDSHPLASLSISSRSRPDVSSLSILLTRLFSSLVDVTPGFVGDHGDAWAAIQATVADRYLERCVA